MSINYIRIGQRIQDARKQKNLSVSELADRVSFTPKSIIFAENGQATFSLELLVSLCTALDISPNQLLADEYICHRSDATQEQDAMLAELRELIQSIRGEFVPEADEEEDITGKDTRQVIREFRHVIAEYKQFKGDLLQGRSSSPSGYAGSLKSAKPATKKPVHW